MKKSLFYLTLIGFVTACSPNEEEIEIGNVQVLNGEAASADRLKNVSKSITLNQAKNGGRTSAIELVQIYELAPPVIDGLSVQATSVSKRSQRIMVSYNFQGEPYKGGLDYIEEENNELAIEAQVLFQEADVNYAEYFSNNLYLVGASGSTPTPSYVHEIEVRGKELRDTGRSIDLGRYAANSADRSGSHLYVTTGDDEILGGGLYQLDFDLEIVSYLPLNDARWVHHANQKLFIAQGTPGRIAIVDERSFELTSTIQVAGSFVAEAKTTLDYDDGYIYFAAGAEGLKVFEESTGSLVEEISFTDESSISNAVSVDDDLVFVSNGEAGIYILEVSTRGNQYAIEVIGWFDFEDGISANHIFYDKGRLFVASGVAGVRIVDITTL